MWGQETGESGAAGEEQPAPPRPPPPVPPLPRSTDPLSAHRPSLFLIPPPAGPAPCAPPTPQVLHWRQDRGLPCRGQADARGGAAGQGAHIPGPRHAKGAPFPAPRAGIILVSVLPCPHYPLKRCGRPPLARQPLSSPALFLPALPFPSLFLQPSPAPALGRVHSSPCPTNI